MEFMLKSSYVALDLAFVFKLFTTSQLLSTNLLSLGFLKNRFNLHVSFKKLFSEDINTLLKCILSVVFR